MKKRYRGCGLMALFVSGMILYISYRNQDGSWTQARNLGKPINSRQDENFPSISNDGRHLFYVKNGTVYWVGASIIAKR